MYRWMDLWIDDPKLNSSSQQKQQFKKWSVWSLNLNLKLNINMLFSLTISKQCRNGSSSHLSGINNTVVILKSIPLLPLKFITYKLFHGTSFEKEGAHSYLNLKYQKHTNHWEACHISVLVLYTLTYKSLTTEALGAYNIWEFGWTISTRI